MRIKPRDLHATVPFFHDPDLYVVMTKEGSDESKAPGDPQQEGTSRQVIAVLECQGGR